MASLQNKFIFLINGLVSLLGWNAVLATFDYYSSRYPSQDVYVWFPIPLFLMYVVSGLFWKEIYQRISYKNLIMIGLIALNLIMVLLPMVAYIMKDNNLGYGLCLLLCGMIGFFSNIAQLSCLAVINFMSVDIVSIFNQGIAVSGVSMVSLRIIILAIKGPDSSNLQSIIIYTILTIVVNTLSIALNIKFFSSDEYLNEIYPRMFN